MAPFPFSPMPRAAWQPSLAFAPSLTQAWHANPHHLRKKVQKSDRSEASFNGSLNFRRGDAGSVQWRFTTAGAREA